MSDLKEVLGLLKSSRYDEALTALNGMINDSAKPISVDSRPHSADLDHSKDTLLCHRRFELSTSPVPLYYKLHATLFLANCDYLLV